MYNLATAHIPCFQLTESNSSPRGVPEKPEDAKSCSFPRVHTTNTLLQICLISWKKILSESSVYKHCEMVNISETTL